MLKVMWNDKVCIGAGVCVKSLPSVFQVKEGRLVILPDGAPDEKIREVVSQCPSGALQIKDD